MLCWIADRSASAQSGRKWTIVEDEVVMNVNRWAQSDVRHFAMCSRSQYARAESGAA